MTNEAALGGASFCRPQFAFCPLHFLLAVLCLLPGCRKAEPPPSPPTKPAQVSADLAGRAREAFGRRDFAAAADLYEQAVASGAADQNSLADWRRRAALSLWLAGRIEPGLEAAAGEASADLRLAMECYIASGRPTDDPAAMADVLAMAPALRLWNAVRDDLDATAGRTKLDDWPGAAEPGRLMLVNTRWSHLARLAELFAAWTALDRGHRPDERVRVVGLLTAGQGGMADSSGGGTRLGLTYPLGEGLEAIQSPAVPAGRAYMLGEWVDGLGRSQSSWNPPPAGVWHLLLGVMTADDGTGRGELLDWWMCSGSWQLNGARYVCQPDASAEPAVLFYRPAWRPLLAGWELALKSNPDGPVGLDATRGPLLEQAVSRLAGNGFPLTRQEQGETWWYRGPAADPLVVQAASWLVYRGWPMPPEAPATKPDPLDEDSFPPLEPDQP